MIIMYPVHPVATLKWFSLLVVIFLGSVVLDIEANFEPVDDLEGQKYFVAEPAAIKLNETKIESNETVVIATYNQASRLQCRHRCNRNKGCSEVIVKPDNICVLLGEGDGESLVITDGERIDVMETISKIEFLRPGK